MILTNEAKTLIGIVVISVALLLGAVFFLSQPEKAVIVDQSILIKDDSNKLSSGSGQLTIVEFGDYQCPACASAHAPLKQVVSENPEVLLLFRHFPLVQHKNAELAARVSEAAKIQNKLVEMHDKLYETQGEWSEEGNALDLFKGYAQGLGLDVDKFTEDVNSDAVKQKVQNDLTDGLALGVNSTPTIYINGEIYKGNLSYDSFKSAIESKLNQ